MEYTKFKNVRHLGISPYIYMGSMRSYMLPRPSPLRYAPDYNIIYYVECKSFVEKYVGLLYCTTHLTRVCVDE